MLVGKTKRPRNVDAARAAAILYGDWGTSKAYVIGLAFAIAGYSSFWLIAAMCALTALVGFNLFAGTIRTAAAFTRACVTVLRFSPSWVPSF